nr:DNA polymerase III subunit beta [bacterium]
MRLNIPREELISALGTVSRAISSKPTMPILEGILLEGKNGALTLMATDLDLGIETHLPADIEEEGRIVLPGRLFFDIVRKLPEGDVWLEVDATERATLTCGGSKTQLVVQNAENYPPMPSLLASSVITLGAATLKNMIRQTVFAVAADETRPILTGTLLEMQGGQLRLVSLDGHRLALRTEQAEGPDLTAVVPGKSLNEVSRVLGDDGEVQLELSPSHLMCTAGSTRIITRLLSGEFTRYRSILSSGHTTAVTVDARALQDSIERASLLAREGRNNLVTFQMEGESMVITSNSEMGSSREELPVEITGNDLEIRFNARFMLDVLRVLDEDTVRMCFNTPLSPCTICPAEGEAFLYLIMPVRM